LNPQSIVFFFLLTFLGINRAGGSAGTAMLDEDQESRRASSRGIIPRAKIKTVKMTFVIVFGKFSKKLLSAAIPRLKII
jgi:hypothetical protein